MLFAPLALALGLFPAGTATVRLPTLPELAQAVASNDEVESSAWPRASARSGSPGWRSRARSRNGWRLCARSEWWTAPGRVCPRSAGWAPTRIAIGEAATLAAQRIAERLSPEAIENEEVPRDIPVRAARELTQLALGKTLPPRIRLTALLGLGALVGLGGGTRVEVPSLVTLLGDPEIAVRHAAVETLAALPEAARPLEATLAADSSVEVAGAAAAALCRDVPATDIPKNPAEERAARLGVPARTRLRALAVDDKLALTNRLELVGCLRVATTPPDKQDREVLNQLARRGPEALKRRARTLGGR